MKIFISYRRADSGRDVGRMRDRLKKEFGEQSVFRDLVDIPAGVDYRTVLNRETNGCDVMLVVIGPLWAGVTDAQGNKRLLNPEDPTRIEIETGLQRVEKGKVMVIPVLIMDAKMPSQADIPESLSQLRNQNAISINDDPYFDFDMERLIRDIRRAQGYGKGDITPEYFEPETIYIAEGPFWMGSIERTGVPAYETPQHKVELPTYRIGIYPVTNSQYEVFIHDTGTLVAPSLRWDGQSVPAALGKHPVTGITWYEAVAYCQWLSEKTKRNYVLPNEAQWEKACRGGNNYIYPWGDGFDPARCNHGKPALAAVDAYLPQNKYGCFDLVGNIRQWTCTLWGEKRPTPSPRYSYPWKEDGRNDLNANGEIRRVVRGSSFKDVLNLVRCTARSGLTPDDRGVPGARQGFRVAIEV